MKFHFVWVGKTKNQHFKALQDDYLRRLSHFVRYDIAEVRDASGSDQKEIEGKRLLEKVNHTSFVCVLDVSGTSLDSHELARQVEKWRDFSLKEVTFVIGGANGVSAEVADRADHRLSLSFLTLTHEMARVLLIEQLYRAFTIINGFPYQK